MVADRRGAGDRQTASSSPPTRPPARSAAPAISSVTALATRRPPGRSASRRVEHAGIAAAAADEDASGRGGRRAPPAPGRRRPQPAARRGRALRRMRAARIGPLPRRRGAGSTGRRSIHSIAIEPDPAPISHSSSPRQGASAASVTARTSRLVIWPSCSNKRRRAGRAAASAPPPRRRPPSRPGSAAPHRQAQNPPRPRTTKSFCRIRISVSTAEVKAIAAAISVMWLSASTTPEVPDLVDEVVGLLTARSGPGPRSPPAGRPRRPPAPGRPTGRR